VLLENGGAEEGDVVVGADGIRSVVREAVAGSVQPRYSGHIAWRAVTRFEHEALAGTFTETWGPAVLFGTVPIGGGRVYWYVSERAPEHAALPPSPKAEFVRRFSGWHEPIPALVEATDEAALLRTFIYDRPPLRRWSSGRVTLAGDAAHPMVPNLGQGAAQALEDAVALAGAFRAGSDVEDALWRYETARRKRANRVVKQSRQAGQTAQLRGPAAAVRNALLRALPDRVLLAQQRKLYDRAV
jgi:2-polyprenyl-6-methoxyphenol hydroxylase-like FAD-dependent oxidoreductase